MTEAEIGWLAGIFEGEGSACICKQHFGKSKRAYIYVSRVTVVNNCDGTVLKRVKGILNALGLRSVTQIYDTRCKPCGKVVLTGHEANAVFLRLVLPLLDGYKKSQSQLVLTFLERRVKRGRKIGSRTMQLEWKSLDAMAFNRQSKPQIVM